MSKFYTMGLTGLLFLIGFYLNLHFVRILSPDDYVEYGKLVLIISVANSTGALGMEQLAFRQIKAQKEDIFPITVVFYCLLTSSCFASVLMLLRLIDVEGFLMILLLSMNMVLGTILKGLGYINYSILTLNGFKLSILVMVFFTWSLNLAQYVIIAGLLLSILSVIIMIVSKRYIMYYERPRFSEVVPYFLALISMSAISYFDKIILFFNSTSEVSSEFYLYSSTIIAPFAVVQVVASTRMVYYYSKAENTLYTTTAYIRQYLVYVVLGVCASVLLLFWYTESLNIELILIFTLTGLIRLVYTNYSSFISVNLQRQNHGIINLYCAIVILVVLFIVFLDIRPQQLALGFLILWLSRTLVWSYVAKKN